MPAALHRLQVLPTTPREPLDRIPEPPAPLPSRATAPNSFALGPRLLDALEAAEIVGLPGCTLLREQTLADALLPKLHHTVLAEGVVAAASEGRVGRPRTTRLAAVRMITRLAEAP
jgi:hypothetical protein